MRSNKYEIIDNLAQLGIAARDAEALRRIAMTLHRWHEYECGIGDSATYCIERETPSEDSHPHLWRHDASGAHDLGRIPDRENGAKKRLGIIMGNYPQSVAYIQGDPRGAPLYIVPASVDSIDNNYMRGVAVYK